MLVAQNIPF